MSFEKGLRCPIVINSGADFGESIETGAGADGDCKLGEHICARPRKGTLLIV